MYNGTVKCTMANVHDLATAKGNGKSISYHYDMDGVRDSKTVDGVKHEYITQGGNVTLERWKRHQECREEEKRALSSFMIMVAHRIVSFILVVMK